MLATDSASKSVGLAEREVKHATIYTISAVVTRLGNLILVPVYWQKLTLTDYGIIGVIELVGSFLGTYLCLSLDVSISRFYYEWPDHARKARLGTVWITSWLSSIILGLISLVVFSFISSVLFPDVAFFPYVFFSITYAILSQLDRITFTTIRIKRLPWLYSAYSVLSFLLQAFLSIYFVVIMDWKVLGYLVALNISELLIVLAGIGLMVRFAQPNIHTTGIKESLKFSLPLIPNAVLGTLSSVADRFLLQQFTSLEMVGAYSLSLKFVSLIPMLHEAIKMSFVPFVFQIQSEKVSEAREIIGQARLYYLIPLFVFGVGISGYVDDFVHLVGQPQFLQVAVYTPLLVGLALLDCLYAYYAIGLLLAKRTDLIWRPSLLRLICIGVAGLILVPILQVIGVILSRYLVILLFTLYAAILAQRYYPIQMYWPKTLLATSLVLMAIGTNIVIHFDSVFFSIIWHTLLTVITGVLMLFAVGGGDVIRNVERVRLFANIFNESR